MEIESGPVHCCPSMMGVSCQALFDLLWIVSCLRSLLRTAVVKCRAYIIAKVYYMYVYR